MNIINDCNKYTDEEIRDIKCMIERSYTSSCSTDKNCSLNKLEAIVKRKLSSIYTSLALVGCENYSNLEELSKALLESNEASNYEEELIYLGVTLYADMTADNIVNKKSINNKDSEIEAMISNIEFEIKKFKYNQMHIALTTRNVDCLIDNISYIK